MVDFSNEYGIAGCTHVCNHISTILCECNGIFESAIEQLVVLLHRLLIYISCGIVNTYEYVHALGIVNSPASNTHNNSNSRNNGRGLNRVSVEVLLLRYGGCRTGTGTGTPAGLDGNVKHIVCYVLKAIRGLYHAQIQFFTLLQIQFAPHNNITRGTTSTSTTNTNSNTTATHSGFDPHAQSQSHTSTPLDLDPDPDLDLNLDLVLVHILNPMVLHTVTKGCREDYCLDLLYKRALVDFPGDR